MTCGRLAPIEIGRGFGSGRRGTNPSCTPLGTGTNPTMVTWASTACFLIGSMAGSGMTSGVMLSGLAIYANSNFKTYICLSISNVKGTITNE